MRARMLWTFDHLVERKGWDPGASDADGCADPGLLKRARFMFDWKEAERAVDRTRAALDNEGDLTAELERLELGIGDGAQLGEALSPEEGRQMPQRVAGGPSKRLSKGQEM